MQIILNGQNINIEENLNLLQCLQSQNIDSSKVVVELNKNIIPQTNFATTILKAEDILEVLHFVGGG